MVQLSTLLSVATSAALVAAAPAVTPLEGRAAAAAPASCTFSGATGFSAVAKGKTSCSTITLNNLQVPGGQTLDLTGLKAGTQVIFQGTTTFGYALWVGPLISVSGTNIHVTGAAGNSIWGEGARWWDGKGGNGGKKKPKFFFAHSLTNSIISGLNFKDAPVQLMSINGAKGLTIDKINYDNSLGDTKGGHNTDAFDVGSSQDVWISNAVVQNQDDCLAINSGTNITFTGGSCSGGHGLSIGSVGGRSDNVVKTVRINSSSISNSSNGVRIKTVEGTTGSVSDVIYKDITLSNISSYGIVIEQDYNNGSPSGKPTTGVPITDVTLSNIHGTVTSSGTEIYVLCGKGSCSSWTWSQIAITGGKKNPNACMNVPTGASC